MSNCLPGKNLRNTSFSRLSEKKDYLKIKKKEKKVSFEFYINKQNNFDFFNFRNYVIRLKSKSAVI